MQPNAGRKKITSLLFVDPRRPRRPRSAPDVPRSFWNRIGSMFLLANLPIQK